MASRQDSRALELLPGTRGQEMQPKRLRRNGSFVTVDYAVAPIALAVENSVTLPPQGERWRPQRKTPQ